MSRERRKNLRIEWESPASVEVKDGRGRIGCIVNNLSNGGARITCAETLPDEFVLRLTPGRGYPRTCRVMWRLGVRFIDSRWEPVPMEHGRIPEWVS